MQVLFVPVARDYGPEADCTPDDLDISAAVDVLVATALITETAGRAAKADIAPVHSAVSGEERRILRVV